VPFGFGDVLVKHEFTAFPGSVYGKAGFTLARPSFLPVDWSNIRDF
jgi:hypothetical protein